MKRARKNIGFLVGTGMGLGAGSIAVGAVGGPTAALGNAAAFMPAAGSVMGAGMVMEAAGGMFPKRRKGKRR